MNEHPGPGGRRAVVVAVVCTAAAALAGLFFHAGFRGVVYDSYHFYVLSQIVSTEGLGNLFSRVRGYGYPLFAAAVTGFTAPSPETTRALAATAQVLLHLATSFCAARVAERIFRPRRLFEATFAVMALNPIVLIRATELLSDSVSASLGGLALFVSIEPGRASRRVLLAFLAAGLAVAVRTANLALLPALVILWLLRGRQYQEPALRDLALAALAVALTVVPQLYGNLKAYGEWSPLPANHLYREQVRWGTGILKYGTLVVPGQAPTLVYANPLRPEGVDSPREFLRQRPLGYLRSLGAHGFAMIDQDLPFTYIQDPRPPAGGRCRSPTTHFSTWPGSGSSCCSSRGARRLPGSMPPERLSSAWRASRCTCRSPSRIVSRCRSTSFSLRPPSLPSPGPARGDPGRSSRSSSRAADSSGPACSSRSG